MAITAKERNRDKLLIYFSNINNTFISRERLSTEVLGYKNPASIYQCFTPGELDEIEQEALAIRRKKYAPQIAEADKGLFKAAAEGNPAAAKLVYQRFEGWSESSRTELTGRGGGPIKIQDMTNEELLEIIKQEEHSR